jgi:hypothetical protein
MRALHVGPTRSSPPFRHPEVRAERASKDAAEAPRGVALRGPLRGHLRMTGMARRHLDNSRCRAFIPRIIFRARRGHDTPTCGKSASGRQILRSRGRPTNRPGGAPGGAAPVRRASQTCRIGRRASRAGVATPFVRRAIRSLASSGKGSRKPLAPPGAPFSFRREKGNGRPRAHASAGATKRWQNP